MKYKFAYRKVFQKLLNQLGVSDATVLQGVKDNVSGAASNRLINPQRQVLHSLLSRDLDGQRQALTNLRQLVDQKNQQRTEDNKALENG